MSNFLRQEPEPKYDMRTDAACLNENPELFFPLGSNAAQEKEAKSVCKKCPVSLECLEIAMDQGNDDGIWGGLTETERKALRRHNVSRFLYQSAIDASLKQL